MEDCCTKCGQNIRANLFRHYSKYYGNGDTDFPFKCPNCGTNLEIDVSVNFLVINSGER